MSLIVLKRYHADIAAKFGLKEQINPLFFLTSHGKYSINICQNIEIDQAVLLHEWENVKIFHIFKSFNQTFVVIIPSNLRNLNVKKQRFF